MTRRASVSPWWIVAACLVCQMGLGLGTFVLGAFLKPIASDLGWSRAAFAFSTFPLLVGLSFGSPVAGALLERVGARWVLGGGITLVTLGLFLFGAIEEIWHLYAVVFLLGIGVAGLGDVPIAAVVSRWFREKRGTALGVVFVGSNLGGAVLPVVAAAIMEEATWRIALFSIAAGGWLVIFPVAWWVGGQGSGVGGAPDESVTEDEAGTDLAGALRTRDFWVLAGAVFAFLFYYVGVTNHLAAYLSDLGWSDVEAARGFGAAAGLGVLGKLGMGLLADRIPRRAAAVGTFATIGVGALLLAGLGFAPVLLPVFLVIHGLSTAENIVIPLLLAERLGTRHFARIYGVMMIAMLPGGAGGPVFAGWVFDATASYTPAFLTFAALNLAAALAMSRLGAPPRPAVSEAAT